MVKLSYLSDVLPIYENGNIFDANDLNKIIKHIDNNTSMINNDDDVIDTSRLQTNVNMFLNRTKSTLYYNCSEYMKVDYNGTTVYDTELGNYSYTTSDWNTQHMYYDDELSTFIPSLPYQDPFKAIVTLKMPLAFNMYNESHQNIVMCQDFILGDGQDDHNTMCPKWYNHNNGMHWDGTNTHGCVVKYNNNVSPVITTNEHITLSFTEPVALLSDDTTQNTNTRVTSTKVFQKITSLQNIDLSKYEFTLVHESSKSAVGTIYSTNKYYQISTVAITSGLASIPDALTRFIFEPASDFNLSTNPKIYLKEKDSGKYVCYASKDFSLSATRDNADYYLITFKNNNVILTTSLGTVICYNPSSPRFKIYDSSYMESNNGYIQLYGYTKPEKRSPELYWNEPVTNIELYIGSNYTNTCSSAVNTLLKPTYKSSNTEVATVDENGYVTILQIGETIITATTPETDDYISETIQYKINAIQYVPDITQYKYLVAFIYPLIRITDKIGHTYSPLLISGQDNNKTVINEKYCWMENTESINTLVRNINNSYKQNIINFTQEHIKQCNKTLIGGDGYELPASINDLVSERLTTWGDLNGTIQNMDSVIKMHIDNKDTIEIFTIDEDGYTVSCGLSTTYDELLHNYNKYKEFISDKVPQEYLEKFPWLFN